MAGRETGKALAIRPAGWPPARNKSRIARRVGSASAWKVASVEYVTERFRIMRNYRVTDQICQENFSIDFCNGGAIETRLVGGLAKIKKSLVDTGIVAEFGMERRSHDPAL